jgi:NADP-dependent 3-hydroxy acid dehydrogenase YdfG
VADDPVLLITGASSGIGAATARQAAEAGWRLVLAARTEERLQELATELGGEPRAVPVPCDVQSWEDQQDAVRTALDTFGRLDASLANAGFGAKRGFLEEDVDFWREMVLTNVYGVALSIRAALPHFLERGRGHMLLMGSLAGRRALPGSLYSASKFAVTAMGEGLRQEVVETDIKVTVIEPGQVDTPFFHEPKPDALKADDIARAVLFALSQPPHVDVNEILVRPIRQAL